MSIESRTVTPRPTGSVRGTWREQYGHQSVDVRVDSGRAAAEIQVAMERRWGPQICDTRRQDFRLSREGAETLRDALTAALEWQPPTPDEGGAS